MVLRLIGYFFLCLAIAALAYDGMRMIADNGHLAFTSMQDHWLALSPGSLAVAQHAVEGVNVWLWSPLTTAVLAFPAWIVLGGLGILFYLAGYRPPRPSIPDGI